MAGKDAITLYYDWLDSLDMLDPGSVWEMIKAIAGYCRCGTEPPVFENPAAEMAKSFIFARRRRSGLKAEAGRLGGIASGKARREKKMMTTDKAEENVNESTVENVKEDSAEPVGEDIVESSVENDTDDKKEQPAPVKAKAENMTAHFGHGVKRKRDPAMKRSAHDPVRSMRLTDILKLREDGW